MLTFKIKTEPQKGLLGRRFCCSAGFEARYLFLLTYYMALGKPENKPGTFSPSSTTKFKNNSKANIGKFQKDG